MIITGIKFGSMEMLKTSGFAIRNARMGIMADAVIFGLFSMMYALSGWFIVKKRSTHPMCVFIWAIMVFFLGAIPLLSQATVLVEIASIKTEDINTYCAMDQK